MQRTTVNNQWAKELVFTNPGAGVCARNALGQHQEKLIELRSEYEFFCSLAHKYFGGGELMRSLELYRKEHEPAINSRVKIVEHLTEVVRLYKVFKKEDILDVDRAKRIPIEDFIQFNRYNKAECIWHTDSDPSMHLYREQNRVHCFSCGQGGDVIEVIRQVHTLDFKQAVEFLT